MRPLLIIYDGRKKYAPEETDYDVIDMYIYLSIRLYCLRKAKDTIQKVHKKLVSGQYRNLGIIKRPKGALNYCHR